jgi:hypothetical protein
MALGTPTSRYNNQTAGTFTSTSITVPSGDVIFLDRSLRTSTAQPSAPTIADSQGLTWTQLIDQPYRPATVGMRKNVWWAVSNGNAMSITVTAGTTGANQGRTDVWSVSGVDTSQLTNAAAATSATGAPSVSLPSAPGAGSTVVSGFIGNGSITVPPPTGYTELDEIGTATAILEVAYKAGSASQTVAYSVSGDAESIAFAIELVAAAGTTASGALSSTGAATVSPTGAAIASGPLTSAGVGTPAPVGAVIAAGGVSAAGTGVAAPVGASIASGPLSSAGTGTLAGAGRLIAAAVLSTAGVGVFAAVGIARMAVSGAFAIIGAAVSALIGNNANATFHVVRPSARDDRTLFVHDPEPAEDGDKVVYAVGDGRAVSVPPHNQVSV